MEQPISIPEDIEPSNSEAKTKKKSTKKIIEETSNPENENIFIQKFGENTQRIEPTKSHVGRVSAKLNQIESGKLYNAIHTHPSTIIAKHLPGLSKLDQDLDIVKKYFEESAALHSSDDLQVFLTLNNQRYATIAVTNPETGELWGYNVLMKTKKTPPSPIDAGSNLRTLWEFLKIKWGLGKLVKKTRALDNSTLESVKQDDFSINRKVYDDLLKEYHLKSRLVPAEGYKINKTRTNFEGKG